MFFPDLESVQRLAIDMSKHTGEQKYFGKYPETEDELLEARENLSRYVREVWKDEIFAKEIELGAKLTRKNYDEEMRKSVLADFGLNGLGSISKEKTIILVRDSSRQREAIKKYGADIIRLGAHTIVNQKGKEIHIIIMPVGINDFLIRGFHNVETDFTDIYNALDNLKSYLRQEELRLQETK